MEDALRRGDAFGTTTGRELDEASLCAEAEATFGPVTDAHIADVRAHILRLEAAVCAAYGEAATSPVDIGAYLDPIAFAGALPANGLPHHEHFPSIHDEGELRVAYMRSYRETAVDQAMDLDAQVTGSRNGDERRRGGSKQKGE